MFRDKKNNYRGLPKLAFLMHDDEYIRDFWVAFNSRYPMQIIKTMWKAIFQNKLTTVTKQIHHHSSKKF
jgi:hypothetical protein